MEICTYSAQAKICKAGTREEDACVASKPLVKFELVLVCVCCRYTVMREFLHLALMALCWTRVQSYPEGADPTQCFLGTPGHTSPQTTPSPFSLTVTDMSNNPLPTISPYTGGETLKGTVLCACAYGRGLISVLIQFCLLAEEEVGVLKLLLVTCKKRPNSRWFQ